jgi:TonB-dependent SusC/RagA subfamily outer membrane receptor
MAIRTKEGAMLIMTARAVFSGGLLLLVGAGCTTGRPSTPPIPDSARSLKDEASTVDAREIERESGRDPFEALSRIPGVEVSRADGGGVSIRIRGAASFYGNTQPLYVLDGVEITPGPGGSLIGLNPHDIETIKVLKDPADAALYGVRGGNGVIVITTKRPGRRPR